MKISKQWLSEWVNIPQKTQTLVDTLTMAGLEVDGVEPVALPFSKVVIGRIIDSQPHPDAQRLSICQVQINDGSPLTIVCGATNAHTGKKVAVALVGAKLGDLKIKKAKLRGVTSFGMLCSASELGLCEKSDGIMHLPDDAPLGEDLYKYLSLDDEVIDIDLTPNRGDCLSILGVAREAAALLESDLIKHESIVAKVTDDSIVSVSNHAPEACLQYHVRIIKNINSAAETPVYIQERLRRSGVRLTHPVVDVCNYVMLELGQPMHAFDQHRITGDIQIRWSKVNEHIKLLNNTEKTLNTNCLVIADDNGPQAMAGIMGSASSSVTEKTTSIVLESALFSTIPISTATQAYQVSSDSAYRFERGVDPALVLNALERATVLLLDIVGGDIGAVSTINSEQEKTHPIPLSGSSIRRHLGIVLERPIIESLLARLNFKTEANKSGWMVTAPSYRYDIEQEIDLIEEIARLYGYNQIPEAAEKIIPKLIYQDQPYQMRQLASKVLLQCGYYEAISYSFCDRTKQSQLFGTDNEVILKNPINETMNVMRKSLLPGLLDAACLNINHKINNVRLFEMGSCYYLEDDRIIERPQLAMLLTGKRNPVQWGDSDSFVDFFDIKGHLETLFRSLNLRFSFGESKDDLLHPGRRLGIYKGGLHLGDVGEFHPKHAVNLGFNQKIYLASMDLKLKSYLNTFKAICKFPESQRDLAFVVDEAITHEQLTNLIKELGGPLLSKLGVFDVYQGKTIKKNEKSIALGLTFQDPCRTLVDTEINDLIQSIVTGVISQLGAKLRT